MIWNRTTSDARPNGASISWVTPPTKRVFTKFSSRTKLLTHRQNGEHRKQQYSLILLRTNENGMKRTQLHEVSCSVQWNNGKRKHRRIEKKWEKIKRLAKFGSSFVCSTYYIRTFGGEDARASVYLSFVLVLFFSSFRSVFLFNVGAINGT